MTVLSDYSVPLAVALDEANPVHQAMTQVSSIAVASVEEVTHEPVWPWFAYFLARYPTLWPCAPHASSTIKDSLADYFVASLPEDQRIERVYWDFDGIILKVWTIVNVPDDEVEDPIYDAQLRFMARFPELDCDFVVIYRLGKALDDMWPAGARAVLLRE